MLSLSIVLITSALVLYTLGVWTEHRSGSLRWPHAALFAGGLTFDALGTATMAQIAASGGARTGGGGGALMGVMAVTGGLALAVMALHLGWAVVVLLRGRESEKAAFHRLSLGVWALWLLPYATGALGAAL